MKYNTLKQYEGKTVRVFLKNNYTYIIDDFVITEDCCSGFDKEGQVISFDIDYVMTVIPISGIKKEWNS